MTGARPITPQNTTYNDYEVLTSGLLGEDCLGDCNMSMISDIGDSISVGARPSTPDNTTNNDS